MRVAVVHPDLTPLGGGERIMAHLVEALSERHDVTLICARPVPWSALDERFGTRLARSGVRRRVVYPFVGRLCRTIVMRHWVMRACRRWRDEFDLVVSSQNELDFGRAGMQYVNDTSHGQDVRAATSLGRELTEFPGPFLRRLVSGFRAAGVQRNRTLAYSEHALSRFQAVYGGEGKALYPPVPDLAEGPPWTQRRFACAWVGRLNDAVKRPEMAIRIVESLRARGFPLKISLFGERTAGALIRHAERLCEERRSWCALEGALPARELWSRLERFQYGLSTCEVEGFGLSTAEMAKLGCVVFVPDAGGQVEIIRQKSLRFRSEDEAVERMAALMGDPAAAARMSALLRQDAARFSVASFRKEILAEAEAWSPRR